MCSNCIDLDRTIHLLEDLTLYADQPGADLEFANILGYSLAASLTFCCLPVIEQPGEEC